MTALPILSLWGEGDHPKGGGEGYASGDRLAPVFVAALFRMPLHVGAPPAPPCFAWSPSPKRERMLVGGYS